MAYWLQLTNRQPISAQGGMDGGQEQRREEEAVQRQPNLVQTQEGKRMQRQKKSSTNKQ